MTSYYKTIKGIQYDKAMLELADNSVSKKKDGRISLADAKKIIGLAVDAGKITDTESRTLNFIYDHYNFTETASEYFKNYVFEEKFILPENQNSENEIDMDVFGIKEFIMKYYLLIIFIILIIILIYINSDRLSLSCEKTDQSLPTTPETQNIIKTPEATKNKTQNIIKSSEVTKQEPTGEYTVKEKDSLIGISQSLYGDYSKWKGLYNRNKDIIKNPTIIFPGQKLKTDIK